MHKTEPWRYEKLTWPEINEAVKQKNDPNAARITTARKGGRVRRTAAMVSGLVTATLVASMALGLSSAAVASAGVVVPVSYGTATFCQVVTQPVSTYTWQQELTGTIPTTSVEELYVRPPSQVNDYAGTAKVAWFGEIAYLAANGVIQL